MKLFRARLTLSSFPKTLPDPFALLARADDKAEGRLLVPKRDEWIDDFAPQHERDDDKSHEPQKCRMAREELQRGQKPIVSGACVFGGSSVVLSAGEVQRGEKRLQFHLRNS